MVASKKSVVRDMGESRDRHMAMAREKGNMPLRKGCDCAGCPNMCMPGSCYCSFHEMEYRGEQRRMVPQEKTVFLSNHTRSSSYGVKPENSKNKL